MLNFSPFSRPMRFAALALFILLIQSCSTFNSDKNEFNPAYADYINAFTGGSISSQSSILIEFTEDIPNATAGEEVMQKYLKLTPAIEGKLLWKNARTLEFKPAENLPQGRKYKAVLKLGELFPVEASITEFHFSFQVLKQFAHVEITEVLAQGKDDYTHLTYKGTVITNDVAIPLQVQKMLQADQVGIDLKIRWEHSKNGKVHTFLIDSVQRRSKESQLNLAINSKEIGSENKIPSIHMEIPAIGDFKVLQINTPKSKEQSVILQFSDPLDPSQDLRGLVEIPGVQGLITQINKNQIIVYIPERISGRQQIFVHQSIRNSNGISLQQNLQQELMINELKPAVKMLDKGVIVPGTSEVKIPFAAVNLRAVQVKIVKIFESGVLQFLQTNTLDGEYEMKRVGRMIYKRDIPLVSEKDIDLKNWNTFALELNELIETEPGAIYRVYISFRQEHSLYDCDQEMNSESLSYSRNFERDMEQFDHPSRYYYNEDGDYDYSNFDYRERNNPCHPSYYMGSGRVVARNILASNFGLTVKEHSDREFRLIANDLLTAKPIQDLEVELYNYQQQLLDKAKTDKNGFATFNPKGKGFVVVAKRGKERGYLKIDEAATRSLSMFDVGGEEIKLGVKGAIYTERGVWRPGDSLYVTFVLEDKLSTLPEKQPVVFELYNPNGQLIQKKVISEHLNRFYLFKTATDPDAPTGNWNLYVQAGGSVFSKTLKIETVKPNRLKILFNFNEKIFKSEVDNLADMEVRWLSGASAGDIKAVVDMQLFAGSTQFENFEDYVFDDESKTFYSEENRVFEGQLNTEGKAQVKPEFAIDQNVPGMLRAYFKIRAFEKSGDFSTQQASIGYSPFSSYVGFKLPEGSGWSNSLMSDQPILIPVASVDETGKPVSRDKIRIEIYDIAWSYWWEDNEEQLLSDYISAEGRSLIKTDFVSTVNGKVNYELSFDQPSWGKKFIRVIDPVSGHSSGTLFYTSYSGWWNPAADNPEGAEMLTFSTDKEVYEVGEEIKVSLPGLVEGKALVSLEKGSKILDMFWVDAKNSEQTFTIRAKAEMSPNAYLQISVIQAADQLNTDHPIRMYGIKNLAVIDPESKLMPVISMKEELKPLEKVKIAVKEEKGKAMTYTLAVVDEGLLDLTSFSTPDLWSQFYKKEALAVKTWDLYPFVMNPFKGELAGLLAIGGGEGQLDKQSARQNRFIPVVKFLGPFHLKAGAKAVHEFEMPNYVGSVRVMLVAGEKGAYGSAEKTVPVKQSLMVLGTLPRIVGPGEQFALPVTLFVEDKKFDSVEIEVKAEAPFKVIGNAVQRLSIDKTGEHMLYFELSSSEKIATGKIKILASGGNEKSSWETYLEVRIPNPPVTTLQTVILAPGESWTTDYQVKGLEGTNEIKLEVSGVPSINLKSRLDYLIQYPHGCIEQTTSAVFPQLYLSEISKMSEAEKKEVEKNVKAGISRIKNCQTYTGGFSYWPGESYDSEWGTNYALHFLLEAKAKGYIVQNEMLDRVIAYQTTQSNEWRSYSGSSYYGSPDLIQSYRLYTLALAGKANLGAMNRLLNESNLSDNARYRLAATYYYAGRKDIADQLFSKASKSPKQDYYDPYTYGDYTRDMALLLESAILLNKQDLAKYLFDDLSIQLTSNDWMSTQTTAYALLACTRMISGLGAPENLSYQLTINQKKESFKADKIVRIHPIDHLTNPKGKVLVQNDGKTHIYLTYYNSGVPVKADLPAANHQMEMEVNYYNLAGQRINPGVLKQGTDFIAEVVLRHPGHRRDYTDMALHQLFPAGWEIRNMRMEENSPMEGSDVPRYQDIRDDRVYTYFNLEKGSTKTYRIMLNATYEGKFNLPAISCEAMYDRKISALVPGGIVEVVR